MHKSDRHVCFDDYPLNDTNANANANANNQHTLEALERIKIDLIVIRMMPCANLTY